jgi:hypothetical protein
VATVLAFAGLALAYPSGTLAAAPAPIVTQPDVVLDDPILDPGLGQTSSACAPSTWTSCAGRTSSGVT